MPRFNWIRAICGVPTASGSPLERNVNGARPGVTDFSQFSGLPLARLSVARDKTSDFTFSTSSVTQTS